MVLAAASSSIAWKISLLLLLVGGLFATGCKQRTWVSQDFLFPTDSSHNSAQYVVTVAAAGEPGHAYSSTGKKLIEIVIKESGKERLSDSFQLIANDLTWAVDWESQTSITIFFFNKKDRAATNGAEPKGQLLATKRYHIESGRVQSMHNLHNG